MTWKTIIFRNVYHFLCPLRTERPLLHLPRHLSQACHHVCVNKAICFSIAFLIKVKLNKSIIVHEAKERERGKTSCQKLGVINNTVCQQQPNTANVNFQHAKRQLTRKETWNKCLLKVLPPNVKRGDTRIISAVSVSKLPALDR